jgi:hypothetical protein
MNEKLRLKRVVGPATKQNLHIRNVSKSVHTTFKAYCARRDIPMNHAIEFLMRMAVEQSLDLRKRIK